MTSARSSVAGGLDAARVEVLDAVVARLIPSDEVGPGAREAGVVGYIERALAGDYRASLPAYEWGLDALDGHAVSIQGRRFVALEPAEQDVALHDLERGETLGREGSDFFDLVLRHTIEGMFGDPSWGGNAGRVGWELLGYGGPRFVWGELDQAVLAADDGE